MAQAAAVEANPAVEFEITTDVSGTVLVHQGERLAVWLGAEEAASATRAARANHAVGGRRSAPPPPRRANLHEIFPPKNRSIVQRLLASVAAGNALAFYDVSVLIPPDDIRRIYRMHPELRADCTLHFAFEPRSGRPGGGLVDAESFIAAVGDLTTAGGHPLDLMMFEFGCLTDPALATRVGTEEWQALRKSIERTLSEQAVDGQVGKISSNSYGLVTRTTIGEAAVLGRVGSAVRRHGVSPEEMGARVERVGLDNPEVGGEGLGNLIAHVCDRFVGALKSAFPSARDKATLSQVKAEVEQLESLLWKAVEGGTLLLNTRQVLRLQDTSCALMVSEGLIEINEEMRPAESLLRFADFPDLALAHDLKVAEAALGRSSAAAEGGEPAGRPATYVVPLSSAALSNRKALSSFDALFEAHTVPAQSLGFRLPRLSLGPGRSPGQHTMQALHRAGHPIWFTNFTSAIQDFAKGLHLDNAFVEVSAAYLERLCDEEDGLPLLRRMLDVWMEAGVSVVATQVETADRLELLHELDIDLFVRPGSPLNPPSA